MKDKGRVWIIPENCTHHPAGGWRFARRRIRRARGNSRHVRLPHSRAAGAVWIALPAKIPPETNGRRRAFAEAGGFVAGILLAALPILLGDVLALALEILVEAIVALPLVLPPTCSATTFWWDLSTPFCRQGLAIVVWHTLPFTFGGLLTSVLYSTPFFVQRFHRI
jgi:hypothetical protein